MSLARFRYYYTPVHPVRPLPALIIQTWDHCRQGSKRPGPHPMVQVSSSPRHCSRIHEESRSYSNTLCRPRLSERETICREDEPAKTSVCPSDREGSRNCSDGKPGCREGCWPRAPSSHITRRPRGSRVDRRSPCQASHEYTLARARPKSGHGPMYTG